MRIDSAEIIGTLIVIEGLKTIEIMSKNESLINLDANKFNQKVLQNKKLSVVVFYTDWCGSYHMFFPILKALSLDYKNRVSFFSIDFETSAQLAEKIGVRNVPTLLIFREGKLVDNFYGVEPKLQLINRIEKWLKY